MTPPAIVAAVATLVSIALLVLIAVRIKRLGKQQKRILKHLKALEQEGRTRDINQFRQIVAHEELQRRIAPGHSLPSMRGWAISPDFGLLLTDLIDSNRPKTIVELGSGTSTLLCAYQLKKLGRGEVIAIDHEPAFAQQTREQIRRHGLEDYARVISTRLRSSEYVDLQGEPIDWYDLAAAQPLPDHIDLMIVDGPPMSYGADVRYPALPAFEHRLSANAAVLLDDAARPGEQRIVARWASEFPDFKVVNAEAEKGAAILLRAGTPGEADHASENTGA